MIRDFFPSSTAQDKRKLPRLELEVPIILFPHGWAPTETKTTNISNEGFFCHTDTPYAPGDQFRCLIFLPGNSESSPGVCIESHVEVTRVVAEKSEAGFGVGCRIQEYRVLDQAPELKG